MSLNERSVTQRTQSQFFRITTVLILSSDSGSQVWVHEYASKLLGQLY